MSITIYTSGRRPCACRCGQLLPVDARANRKYLDGHKQRAYEQRLEQAATARGVPARLSFARLQTPSPTSKPSADAPKRRGGARGGVTVAYRRVLSVVADDLADRGVEDAQDAARRVVRRALSPRARARLDELEAAA